MQFSTYFHTLDPFAIQFSEAFGIRWYGLAYLAGFLAGYWVIRALASRGRILLPIAQISDFVFSVALGTIIGGRLGYCLFYSPKLLTQFSTEIPFWGVLAVHEGGMASHGGIIGIITACYLYGRRWGIPAMHLCDLTTLGGTIGVFFGRIANFVNGELVGRAAPDSALWRVQFPQDVLSWPGFEPERLHSLSSAVGTVGVSAERWSTAVGDFLGSGVYSQLIESTLFRLIAATQSGNSATVASLRAVLTPRYPSQLIEALLEGLLLFVMLNIIWLKPRRPGVITGSFLVVYALVRCIGEQYRLPDLQIGYDIFGLTRGQLLSFFVLLVGVVVLVLSRRTADRTLGGWFQSVQE